MSYQARSTDYSAGNLINPKPIKPTKNFKKSYADNIKKIQETNKKA